MADKRWRLATPAPRAHLESFRDLPPLAAQLLYSRGIRSRAQADAFLATDAGPEGDPFTLPDMDRAVGRLYRALLSGETIAIYGDFDADGVTATALLVEGLQGLGGRVVPYIPHRIVEGHGLNARALNSLAAQGCTLAVTVDCGITGVHDGAVPRGMDVIVTDHHLPSTETPNFFAAINPHLPSSRYSYPELTGVGFAFKLIQALYSTLGRTWNRSLLELVAVGTIADLGPLVGENRYLVQQGLKAMSRSSRPGLLALAHSARLSLETVDSEGIGYSLAPRINAAGRLEHAMTSYRLLTASSDTEAVELAVHLERLNTRRQRMTKELVGLGREQVRDGDQEALFLLVGGEEFQPGIAGLVAGRLAEEFYRPALVYHRDGDVSRGSGRSIPEFDITAALGRCEDLLSRYGGHHQAAGMVLPTRNLPALQERLQEIARENLAGLGLRPGLDVDAETPLATLPGDLLAFISRLAPFGKDNPQPTFLSRGLQVLDRRALSNGEHLRLTLREGQAVWEAIAFGQGRRWEAAAGPLDIVYTIRTDTWRGRDALELGVVDFAPAAQ